VKYFKQRRVMEHQKAAQLKKLQEEGAVAMPGQLGPNPNADR
jgi:hypothetical protein